MKIYHGLVNAFKYLRFVIDTCMIGLTRSISEVTYVSPTRHFSIDEEQLGELLWSEGGFIPANLLLVQLFSNIKAEIRGCPTYVVKDIHECHAINTVRHTPRK
ncbi:hypothetical protein CDAR_112001 [Caerostris darwini]|uniref:Uncharacterized protein n=1 Tax=Caerostris darwini TaxID=1538125 RepID=A0AAV4QR81_9ARAC|nr:hypothetical protein CDAR_112001 [Caerostris darwini]